MFSCARTLLLFACLMVAVMLRGQQIRPEDEAPEALLQAEIGSSDVELLVSGSWEAELIGSLGYAFPSGDPPYSATFPGMAAGPAFIQRPDILLSLWIQREFYFEASILAGYEINTLQMGYLNTSAGFLRQVTIGTPGPAITAYGNTVVPQSASGSFGVSIDTATEISRHEAMLRIEDFGYREKSYLGRFEVLESSISPMSYRQGRHYILPDSDLDFVDVYVETLAPLALGDTIDTTGRVYTKASPSSYRISSQDGSLSFLEPAETSVVVYYEKTTNGLTVPVGDSSLGVDALSGTDGLYPDPSSPLEQFWFEPTGSDAYLGKPLRDYRVSMAGGPDMLMLYEPGEFSPFEHAGWYSTGEQLPENSLNTRVRLGRTGSSADDLPLSFVTSIFDASEFRIFTSASDPRSPSGRYPLSDVYPFLYGPNRRPADARVDSSVLIQFLEDSGAIQLENPSKHSIVVRRNGFRETGFTVDDSGLLSLSSAALPNDRISITYRTETGGETARNLTFGISNSVDIAEDVFAYALLGGLWNIGQGSYSTSAGEYPGNVTLEAGIDAESEHFTGSLDAAFLIASPDTSGVFRVFGMEGAGSSYRVSRQRIFPAYPPSIPVMGNVRGKLMYKDYHTYGATGVPTLMKYDWPDIPEDQVFSYENGAPTGPYTAGTAGDSISEPVMVLDYDIANDADWVGSQLSLSAGGPALDISRYEGMTFFWKLEDQVGEVRIHVQIGDLGEDLDQDSVLDREISEIDTGFRFNDTENGVELRVGGWDGKPDFFAGTEDTNGNGILDRESDSRVVTSLYEPGATDEFPDAEWNQVELKFDAADRQKLRFATAFRIVLERVGTTDARGRVLVTGPTFVGSTFFADPTAPLESVTMTEVIDSQLTDAYPEVEIRFHPDGQEQRVLAIEWSEVDAVSGWTARAVSPGIPLADYRYLSFYLSDLISEDPGNGRLTLRLYSGDKTAVSATFDLERGTMWRKYALDLRKGELLVGDTPVASATVLVDTSVAITDALSIAYSGTPSGIFYIDEIHLESTYISLGFSADGRVSLSTDAPLLEIASFPIVGRAGIDQRIFAKGDGIEAGGAALSASSLTEAYADIAGLAALGLSAEVIWDGSSTAVAGGHRVTVPAAAFPVSATDVFSTSIYGAEPWFSHNLSLRAEVGGFAGAAVSTSASLRDGTLLQEWTGSLSLLQRYPFSITAEANFDQASDEYEIPSSGYFATLSSAYDQIVPWREDPVTARNGNSAVRMSLMGHAFSAEVSPEIWYRVTGVSSEVFESGGRLSVAAPLTIPLMPPPGITIEPRFSLEFHNTSEDYLARTIGEDLGLFLADLTSRTYLLPGPELRPVFEAETSDDAEAAYEPGVSLTLERGFGSYIRDLFLPSKTSIELTRSLRRVEDTITDELIASARLRSTALNLFGNRGAYPVFDFYRSDEYSWNLAATVHFDSGSFTYYTGLLQHYLFFSGREGEELIIDNRFELGTESSLCWSESLDAVFSWITPVIEGISLPIVNIEVKTDVYFKHEESLTFHIAGDALEMKLGHSSELFLGDKGSISALLHMGGAFEGTIWSFGAEVRVRARISF